MGARRRSPSLGLIVVSALAIIAIGATAFSVGYVQRAPRDDSAVRLTFTPPEGVTLADAASGGQVSISPNGQRLVFVATAADGTRSLWTRSIDSLAAEALPGTEGASNPFWSPDSDFVGFFAQGRLKKTAAVGGPVQTLCDAVLPRGGTWNQAGVILFSANAGRQFYRVAAAGGEAAPLTLDQPNDEGHGPDFLPDGRQFVYYGRRQKPGIYLASLESKETKLLASGYAAVEYVAPGYLLLLAGGPKSETSGTLMAQRFDTGRLQLVGDPIPIAEQVAMLPLFAHGAFSASESGRLVYGAAREQITQLVWFDRLGNRLQTLTPPGKYHQRLDLSPDEKTVAVEIIDSQLESPDIWLMDIRRGVTSRFTFDPEAERFPLWSPDGDRIVFSSPRAGKPPTLFHKVSNGTDKEQMLFGSELQIQPTDWSPDGRFIAYQSLDPKTQWDLWTVPASPNLTSQDRKPVPFLQTPFNENHGHFSPDGRWMAYTSDESGRAGSVRSRVPGRRDTMADLNARWRRGPLAT